MVLEVVLPVVQELQGKGPKMKLTKLKTLQICKELWTWMRDEKKRGYKAKKRWPGWKKYGRMESNCPCCEFTDQHNDNYCENKCLLASVWGRDIGGGVHCINKESAYASFGNERGTPEDAQRIVDGCTREIRKLRAVKKRKVARKKK